MADIFINFSGMPDGYIRGDIDYELEELVRGWGEVSGAGAGLTDPGWNVDLELDSDDPERVGQFLEILLAYLRSLPAPAGTELVLVVGDQKPQHLPVA